MGLAEVQEHPTLGLFLFPLYKVDKFGAKKLPSFILYNGSF